MSYNLELWSVRRVERSSLPEPDEWQPKGDGWSFQGRAQLNIWPTDEVLAEDIPEEVAAALPGIGFLTRITLSAASSRALLSRASRTAKALGSSCHGVVLNPQDETLHLPRGLKRFVPARQQSETRVSVTALTWWSLHAPAFTTEGMAQFAAMLKDLLPEALPRRYGPTEPPQYRYEATGHEHFVEYL